MTDTRHVIGDLDLYLFSQGRHERLWEMLGAHPQDDGCSFAVWAPNARDVRVIGDTAGWSDGIAMQRV
ncbi:MAG TPA: hypothetical protein VHN18_19330, partial [Micromonosporaceae bacterium]|nr:hypothetical protein [Micromonosporaceae bacterium]